MIWKFDSVFNTALQMADHARPVQLRPGAPGLWMTRRNSSWMRPASEQEASEGKQTAISLAATLMMAGSHIVVGVAAWVWAAPHLGLPPFDVVPLAMAIGGSLLPDIDHPQSWVGRRLRVISRPLAATMGHRGFTHSIIAVIACGFLLRWQGLSRSIVAPVVVGYLSHLAADFLTSSGLRLAWPLQRRCALPLCKTGSLAESVIVMAFAIWVGATAMGIRPLSML